VTEWARLLHGDSQSCFAPDELERVRLIPWGDANVYACNRCGWAVQRSGFGVLVPFEVSHDAVRSVVDHWTQEHG